MLFTGLPFERALFWHKLCAYVSVLVGAWHGYVSQEWNASGLLLVGSMAGLCLTALWFVRRKVFEAFYRFHWLLFLLVIGAAIAHGAGAILFGVALWVFDILVRALIALINNRKQRSILAVRLPSNVVRLTFLKEDFSYKSGQYCFICVPGVSLFEWHPFSLSSSPHENMVSLHIRVLAWGLDQTVVRLRGRDETDRCLSRWAIRSSVPGCRRRPLQALHVCQWRHRDHSYAVYLQRRAASAQTRKGHPQGDVHLVGP